MAGLPKLPGLTFSDPTLTKFNKSETFQIVNGYKIPKAVYPGVGGRPLEINSVAYIQKEDPIRFDPSLTYGRTKARALPQFIPHFALYDQKCLTFKGFFRQSVFESPYEHYRVRQVNFIYFLEDNTITVMEPRVPDSGMDQGRLVRRGKIPKTELGDYWHWKDLNIGKDICIYGIVYHLVDCDVFTKEYLQSQGIVVGAPEQMPPDPYTTDRMMQGMRPVRKTPACDDKLRRFLEYDGKVLKFDALWDDRDSEYGELRHYKIMYFLADDTVAVKEELEPNSGRDPFPLLLKKMKLPKLWTDMPIDYPSVYLERSDAEVSEFYQPKDFLVGETIFILGRKFLLVDCDNFTRNYFKKILCIDQKPRIEWEEKKPEEPPKPMPPHDGFGSLEDSLQNTLSFTPKPPRKDEIRQLMNANKYLRYEMVMDAVHPEDKIRSFILLYSLADGTIKIHEPPIKNSGIMGGKYLTSTYLQKPGSDPLNPCYYTPADFSIGAKIVVFGVIFIITGADLAVYRYMLDNREKFPQDVVDNMRNYMFNKGYLKDDLENQVAADQEAEKKARRDAIGRDMVVEQKDLDKCIETMISGGVDPEEEERKKKEILRQYEESLIRKHKEFPHGIQPVNLTCPYKVVIGDQISGICKEGDAGGLAPKHVDTPEEIQQKYYAKVLASHHEVCEHGKPVVCEEPTAVGTEEVKQELPTDYLMISPPEYPPEACLKKQVTFADEVDPCRKDKRDLCNLKQKKIPCDCTQLPPCPEHHKQ